ncbi:MAG TPA: hypothetical protein VIM42_10980 [Clostridium sp.]
MSNEKVWFITEASRGLGFEITKAILAAGGLIRIIQEIQLSLLRQSSG